MPRFYSTFPGGNRRAPFYDRFDAAIRRTYTAAVRTLRFEWDQRKAEANARKHGVTFEEAQTVFSDERAKLIDDPEHSHTEDRFILLGLSSSLRLLVVCHCYLDRRNTIRLISARKATATESLQYS